MTNAELKHSVSVVLKNNIISDLDKFNLKYDFAMQLASIAYDAYFNNEIYLSQESINSITNLLELNSELTPELKHELLNNFIYLYREDLYDRISFYVNGTINGFQIHNDNISLYGKVYKPAGCNSAIYETETKEISKLRKDFLSVMPI
ncbi:MAG: hypothetical protein U0T77_12105 [Chitinophagales bacterium]